MPRSQFGLADRQAWPAALGPGGIGYCWQFSAFWLPRRGRRRRMNSSPSRRGRLNANRRPRHHPPCGEGPSSFSRRVREADLPKQFQLAPHRFEFKLTPVDTASETFRIWQLTFPPPS